VGVPSQTIHIPNEDYVYILETAGDNDTVSGRAAELIRKGRGVEQDNE